MTITQHRGVTYRWCQDEFLDKKFNDDTHLRLNAQEVRELMPEVIVENSNGYFAADYTKIRPVLIAPIKEPKLRTASCIAR